MRLAKLAFLFFTQQAVHILAQVPEKYTTANPCISVPNCHQCIQVKGCVWCYQDNFDDSKRCFQMTNTSMTGGCKEEFIWNPLTVMGLQENRMLTKGEHVGGFSESGYESGAYGGSASYASQSGYGSVSESESFSSSSSMGENQVVQLRPQQINLKLRINEAYNLKIEYAQAEDYPLDLYYLMDLSNSMKNDKEKLSSLGKILSETMTNITSNFRLGFGSFVDKVVMPYVSTVPKKLASPCDGCVSPYGYINTMPLSTNTDFFTTAVANAQVSGNLDAPEGGFDAIMQAVVCRNEIGWREKARRLLVFSTDALFHFAGDGKLGGIVQPNDGTCHLNSRGVYTHSTVQDYPSISHINAKVKENAINIIFAVTDDFKTVYEELTQYIEGSSSGVLAEDSSNVVEFVKEQYKKISSSVEMKDNSSSAVQINYYSSCLTGGEPYMTNKCDGLKVGDRVEFIAEIVVTSCPTDPAEWNEVFHISPIGINETLRVNLELLCECPCKSLDAKILTEQEQMVKCSHAGTYECGVCTCFPGHYGRHCECSASGEGANVTTDSCRPPDGGAECSGRGSCVCGQCDCSKRSDPLEVITGTFCECDNFSCDRNNGSLCSGPTHGKCVCGQCQCLPGWTGTACDCSTSVDSCKSPEGGEICSGHGRCECGQCVCDVTNESHYSGRYCEKCPTCPGRCQEFKDCVECLMYGSGILAEDCSKNCTTFVPIPVVELEQNEDENEYLCTYYDDQDCVFVYVYSYDESNNLVIRAKEKKDCPTAIYLPGLVMGVIAAIVLIGLALLMVWKMVTTISDRREFARFEKERMMAKWDTGENPIYKQATSTFKNPTYAGR